jgi:acetyl esterase/lipase
MRLSVLIPLLVIFAVAGRLAAQPPRRPGAPRLTTAEVKTEEHVYKHTPQGDLNLHFYLPTDWKVADKRPVVLFFFGGGWRNGSHLQFVPQAEYFASRGLVAACADYRIESAHKTTPDKCVEDAKSAMRWLRAKAGEFGVDPERIVAAGGSAGGHLAAATAVLPGFDTPGENPSVSCKPNALILFNPALDVPSMAVKDTDGKDIAAQFWPTRLLAKGVPPTIIFFGTNDRLLAGGRDFFTKGRALGNRVELYTAADQPHGFFNRSPWNEVTAREADRFLVSIGYLPGEPTLRVPDGAPTLVRVSD